MLSSLGSLTSNNLELCAANFRRGGNFEIMPLDQYDLNRGGLERAYFQWLVNLMVYQL